MSRADEIAQGLRNVNGGLIGGLHVEDYVAGICDFEAGNPPPKGITSASYDLGRKRARETAEVIADINARQDASHQKVRELLADKPELLADYDRQIAAIRSGRKPA